MALQFEEVERVVLENQGDCRRWYLFEGEQSCEGIRRSFYERYLGWDDLRHVRTIDPEKLHDQGTVVFYRLNPDFRKVDSYCGARERSYVVRTVEMPEGSKLFLTTALRAYLERVWTRPLTQISVSVQDGLATIDFHSKKGLGIPGTTCGGVGFFGAIRRTTFQFHSIDKIRYELGGSCRRFGNYMQTLRCITVSRDDHR